MWFPHQNKKKTCINGSKYFRQSRLNKTKVERGGREKEKSEFGRNNKKNIFIQGFKPSKNLVWILYLQTLVPLKLIINI